MDNIGETKSGISYRFDPAEHGHYGIAGQSGSGKTVTKRVLLENCINFGYNVISINPNDRQVLRSAYSKEDGETLPGNYYTTGKNLSSPDDFSELVDQNSFITLAEASKEKKEEWITEFFQYLDTLSIEEPLFVFLDEAHNFSSGSPADAISLLGDHEELSIHMVLVMPNPIDFRYDHRDIRENIDIWFFHHGEYIAAANEFIEGGKRIRDLNRGECIVVGRGDEVVVSVRMPESELGMVSDEMLDNLNQ